MNDDEKTPALVKWEWIVVVLFIVIGLITGCDPDPCLRGTTKDVQVALKRCRDHPECKLTAGELEHVDRYERCLEVHDD